MKYAWILAALLLPSVLALSVTNITISPADATTTATLSCALTATGTGTLTANITWYKDGAPWGSDNETISLTSGVEAGTSVTGNIEPSDTTKGDQWNCTATVSNTTATVTATSTNVTIRNSAPIITTPNSTQIAAEDTLYSLLATATDADNDVITTFISSDLNASLYGGVELFDIANNGQISFTPSQTLIGNHTMAILAYDGTDFGGQNILYTVTAVDDVPQFSPALANQAAVATVAYAYTISATDEENNALNFSLATNGSSVQITQLTNTTARITFPGGAPGYADRGYYQLNVTVYENASPSVNTTSTIYLNITAPNRAPYFGTLVNQTGTQGNQFTYTINASDNDTDDTLHFGILSSCAVANPWTINTASNASTNAQGVINLTLTNDHVACPTVTVFVYDKENGISKGGNTTATLTFNITNTNDAPTLANISYTASNTRSQQDLRRLNVSTGEPFTYTINATDSDMLTYAGDTLTYTDNTSLFAINSTTGLISFTPGVLDVGEHSIRITVTDAAGLSANATMNLTVIANDPPAITSVPTIICQEDAPCTYLFSAFDDDANENLTFSTNTSLVNLSAQSFNTSLLNRTYVNDEVGNYTVQLTVTDLFNHLNSTNFTLIINNTNDAPFFDNNQDNTSDVLQMPQPAVVGYPITWLINITDVDMRNRAESETFSTNITTGPNASLFTIQKLSDTQARIQFTPKEADIGSYIINVSVRDASNASTSQLVNFTVRNVSLPPVITAVRPFLNGSTQINSTLFSTSASLTNITVTENTTVTYNISFTDSDSALSNVTVRYYKNGTLVHSALGSGVLSYTESYGFFAAGSFLLNATVEDELYGSDSFVWNVTVQNVNRPPVLSTLFSNRTINSTTTLSTEMNHFYDPDDDEDSNGEIDITETNTLAFTMSNSTYLTATFSGSDVTLTPQASGSASVYYTATDSGALSTTSNNVTYTVFYTENSQSSSSSSGGGGGGGSSAVPRPIRQPDPYAIDIITPKPIVMYENETVIAPIALKNTGDLTLRDITLTAESEENVTLSFLDSTVDELPVDAEFNTSLVITNYKSKGTFEIVVKATVDEPSFNDSAIFFINSMEKMSQGDAVNTKITYARDLLTANPACGELMQIVDQAEQAYRHNDFETAEQLLQGVSDGCTYLQTQAAKEIHNPSLLQTLAGYQYVNALLGVLLAVLVVVGSLLVMHYAKQQ